MFTKNLRFFWQILHSQWTTQTPKKGLHPLGVKAQVEYACIHAYPITMTGPGIWLSKSRIYHLTTHIQCHAPHTHGGTWTCVTQAGGVWSWFRSSHLVDMRPEPLGEWNHHRCWNQNTISFMCRPGLNYGERKWILHK